MLQHSCRTQKNMKNILKTLLAMPGMCKFCAAHSIYAIKKFNALRSPLLKGYGIFGLDLKNWWQQQLEPSFFFNLLLKIKKIGGSVVPIALLIKKISTKNKSRLSKNIFLSWRCQMTPFQPEISTSSLYFGVGRAVLNLSSSNSLWISMSTHNLHAAILGKNAFQFRTLGPKRLAHFPKACACALQWIINLYKMRIHQFTCAAILKPN